jgi:ABC-type oligopeptide transport system substrate-binding subunit
MERKKYMKTRLTILAIAIAALMAISIVAVPVKATATVGPRIDQLLCQIYGTAANEHTAFAASDLDLIDWPLSSAEVADYQANHPEITLDSYRNIGLFEFDINNNLTMPSYPTVTSPTSDSFFREAIAYLVDKPFILSTYVGGLGAILETPIMPWLKWYDPTIPTRSYDANHACQILFDHGWRADNNPNSGAQVHFPATWPDHAGATLASVLTNGPHTTSDPGLIFYRRADKADRNGAGNLLIYGDATHKGLQQIGIPVDDNSVVSSVSSHPVMYAKDFHIYTGGWSVGRDPDYLYDLWGTTGINNDINTFSYNYGAISDSIWDAAITGIKYAATPDAALIASHAACQRFAVAVLFIPLWTTVGYLAHKNTWHALNVDSYGVLNWWNIYCTNNPSTGVTGGTLRWGFASTIEQLNVIYSQWVWDWQGLDKLYDSLIAMNPLNIAVDMPWMATGWTVGTWTNPNTGMAASKITFTLRTDIKWINPDTGTVAGSVTPDDVKFSCQYIYDNDGWNKNLVADLFVNPGGDLKIDISGSTLTFYESLVSTWAMHWIGGVPIIPKYIFEGIADPTGFVPGGLPLTTVLVGSGAFYFKSYVGGEGGNLVLNANRNYFKPIVPNTDTDPVHIKLDWGIFKSNVKDGDWTVNVLDLIRVASALGWTGPPGDIPQDINKDGKVNVLDLIIVATNIGASW